MIMKKKHTTPILSDVFLIDLISKMPDDLKLCVNNICMTPKQLLHFIREQPDNIVTENIRKTMTLLHQWVILHNIGAL